MFTGLGFLPGTYHIELAEGAVPLVHAPRKVPVPQRANVVEEQKRMEKLGVIVRQEERTEWVNSFVVAQKPTGAVRLCIDPGNLNLAIKGPHNPIKTIDEVASRLQGAKTFSILMPQVASGYYSQMKSLHVSVHLTLPSAGTDLQGSPLELNTPLKSSKGPWIEWLKIWIA